MSDTSFSSSNLGKVTVNTTISGAVSGAYTYYYSYINHALTITLPFTGASNPPLNDLIYVTAGIPVGLRPAATLVVPVSVIDAGVNSIGLIEITTTGDITFYATAAFDSFSNAGGAGGARGGILTYIF